VILAETLAHNPDSQWPEAKAVPGFKETLREYLCQLDKLSFAFSDLLAEALGLAPGALEPFYDKLNGVEHRAKVRILVL
jgi:isopenicillin N synthase-like dioxygenase